MKIKLNKLCNECIILHNTHANAASISKCVHEKWNYIIHTNCITFEMAGFSLQLTVGLHRN